MITDVIGALFRTHKELTLPFVDYLYTNILVNAL